MRLVNSKSVMFGLAVCAVALAAYVAFASLGPNVRTITLTEEGFVPSRLLINKGDTVIFVSNARREFWPASDSHPTHGLYPGFDPGRALTAGETWEFTFDKAGVWTFHDHTRSNLRGTILVQGAEGESAENCLKIQTGTIQPQCWEPEVLSRTRAGGVESAFDSIRKWYGESPVFRRNCHDVMHIVGVAAYAEFAEGGLVTSRDEASYCGYGFYHGFVETMLLERGAGQYADARAYCEELKAVKPEAAGPCYHGIGHAVFDSIDGSLWGDGERMTDFALSVCRAALPGEWERVRCGSGVFNALANAYSARTYGLTFVDSDPLPLCGNVPRSYQDFCHMELGNGYIRDKQWEQKKEMDFIRGIGGQEVRAAVIIGYMDTEVKRTIDDIDVAGLAELCHSFLTERDIRACVSGVYTGLRGIGEPEKEGALVRKFCNLFDESYRSACFADTALSNVQ